MYVQNCYPPRIEVGGPTACRSNVQGGSRIAPDCQMTHTASLLSSQRRLGRGPDLDVGGPRALVTLAGHDHVVPGAEVEIALLLPLVEVLAGVDGAADALLAADGPVLVKGRGTLDGRLVDAARLVDVVGSAVVVDRAEPRGARGRVVGAVRLDDVVLDEGVGGPAVERQVCTNMLAFFEKGIWPERGSTYSCSRCNCSRCRCRQPCAAGPGSSPCRQPSC